VKYANIKQIPFRPRLALAILYLAALGLIMTANVIAILADFTAGYMTGFVLQFGLLAHLLNRTS